MPKENLILDENQVLQKIKRIAYEIYENNFQEAEIIIAGVDDKGYELAQMVCSHLQSIAEMKTVLVRVKVDKLAKVQGDVHLDCSPEIFDQKCVVLVDDVLNSGRTLAYCLKPFLNMNVKKVETVVLVNRSHKLFPISADYNGYELSTTLKEHIEVRLGPDDMGVYLF